MSQTFTTALAAIGVLAALLCAFDRRAVDEDQLASLVSFPSTDKMTANNAMVTIVADKLDVNFYATMSDRTSQHTAIRQFDVARAMTACAQLHEKMQLGAFDHVQISYHGIGVLRIKNSGRSIGYSAEIDLAKLSLTRV